MSGYQILALIAISFLLGFGIAWKVENWKVEAAIARVDALEISQHNKAEVAITKIDTVTATERTTYEGKISQLQQKVEAARKADKQPACRVPAVLVRDINAVSAR